MTREDIQRYREAQHAMQTGIQVLIEIFASSAIIQNPGTNNMTPKHLRVGINTALCDNAAMAKLLIEKGLITPDEYEKAIADEMGAEVERIRKMIHEYTGMDVNLI